MEPHADLQMSNVESHGSRDKREDLSLVVRRRRTLAEVPQNLKAVRLRHMSQSLGVPYHYAAA